MSYFSFIIGVSNFFTNVDPLSPPIQILPTLR